MMDVVREYFKGDALAEAMEMKIEHLEPGHAVVSMPIRPMHMNGLNAVHGGSLFSLADFCFAVASNSHGRVAVAVNANISFFRPAFSGTLTACAHETHLGERIAGYTVDITDDANALIATMQGVVYRKKDSIEDIVARRSAGTPN
jgi:acyl-CoA thioesterase